MRNNSLEREIRFESSGRVVASQLGLGLSELLRALAVYVFMTDDKVTVKAR